MENKMNKIDEMDEMELDVARTLSNGVDWAEVFGADIFAMMTEQGAAACRKWLTNKLTNWIVSEIDEGWEKFAYLFDEDNKDYCQDNRPEEVLEGELDGFIGEMMYNMDYNLERYGYGGDCDDPWTPLGNKCYDWLTEEYKYPETIETRELLNKCGFVKNSWQRLTNHGIVYKSWEDEDWYD